jgi:hypothetical protein
MPRTSNSRRILIVGAGALLLAAGAWQLLVHECASGGAMGGRYRTCSCLGVERLDYDRTASDGPRRTICLGWVTARACHQSLGGPEVPCSEMR